MFKKLLSIVLAVIMIAPVPAWAQIAIPHTFAPFTTISSSQVNANFDALGDDALDRTGGTMTGNLTLSSVSILGTYTVAGTYTLGGTPTLGATLVLGGQTLSGNATLTGTITGGTFASHTLSGTILGTYTLGGTPTIPASGLTGTITSATQDLITRTGTITSGTWSGSFGAVSGANLTSLSAANLSGTIANAVQDNITRTGTITSGTWSGNFGVVNGANLTSLTAANIAAGTAGISITGNSATTTSFDGYTNVDTANTASAVVARDGFGSFAAQTVTAANVKTVSVSADSPDDIVIDVGGTVAMRYNGDTSVIDVNRLLYQTASSDGIYTQVYNGAAGTKTHIAFYHDAAIQGSITCGSAACAYNTSSDARFKEDIHAFVNGLDYVRKLEPRTFVMKDYKNDGQKIGFIAQEVLAVFPQAVSKDQNGFYSMDYGRLTPLLTGAIKTLDNSIILLEKRIQVLESKLNGVNP